MAHDPSLGFADYFSAAADATVMEEGPPELYGLHADMEFLGMRGLAAMPGAAHGHSKAAMLDDDGGSTDAATMQFLSAGHQQQTSQAPLSLSLCRPDGGATTLHEHLGGPSRHHLQQPAAWMQQHEYSATTPTQHAGAWHLRSSRFLLPAQQLLHEFCSLPVDNKRANKASAATKQPSSQQQQEADGGGGEGSSSSASWAPSPQIQAMDALELQRLKDKLYIMLEEVDRRYRRYCEQMRSVAGGFEAVAGARAAAAYTALASRTISRHFRSLRDGIVAQLQAARRALGDKDDVAVPGMTRGDTPRLRVLDQCIRQHKAISQAAGGMMETHPWRPQRGLPERAVTILRAWLFEHFLHPYPSDVDKHILARQTGLSRSQVSNWFINARVRLWKPMVEEMYVEEMKGSGQDDDGSGQQNINPNPSSSHASEAAHGGGGRHEAAADGGDNGVDRKPTRAQLMHDAGSLASVVNIGAGGVSRLENFGIMDHLDFDAYGGGGGQQQQQAGGFGGVSLTLGLQQHESHDGGVNIAFGAPPPAHHHHGGGGGAGYLFETAPGHHQQMHGSGGVHPGQQHVQFGAAAGIDGDAPPHAGQDHYRSLGAGFHLLRDLAG